MAGVKKRRDQGKNKGANLGFEATLWSAADKMRNNMDAAEYKHVVLGLIFLKYISDAFEERHAALVAEQSKGADPEDPDEYRAENIFWVPREARWAHLQANAKQPKIGKLLDDAMVAIERDNPSLKGVLPKDYARPALDKQRLGELIDLFLDADKAAEFRRSTVRDGDLVFTCWGTIGQVGLVDKRNKFREYVISNKQMKLTPDPAKADSLFLYYALSGPELMEVVRSQAIGSSVPGFNLGQLRSLKLCLPPLDEQRAIAQVLGALDDKIDLDRRMNETLEGMGRALFKSWFVDFDPVRARAEGHRPAGMDGETAKLFPSSFVESELGKIPKGWKAVPLPDAIEVNPSRALSPGAIAPYVDMGNMPTSAARVVGWVIREFTSGTRFTNGDVLVARITPCLENGKTAFVDFLADGQVGWGSTEYIVLRSRSPLPAEYAYFLARSESFRSHAIANMTGSSGRQRVPTSCLTAFDVIVPTAPVASAFGRLLAAPMMTMRQRDGESTTLATLRDALLPKLLSGEIWVKDVEKFVGARA